MLNIEPTILSQYANSPTLLALLTAMNAEIDPSVNIDAMYTNMWNINTATGYGLDVWGRIVGVSRFVELTVPVFPLANAFGFNSAALFTMGYTPFYSGATVSNNYLLTDNDFRTVILVKALSNIIRATPQAYNRLLTILFAGQGMTYAIDGLDMSMRFTFNFLLSPINLAIIKQSGILALPTGVRADVHVSLPSTFGFNGASQVGFHGTFFSGFS